MNAGDTIIVALPNTSVDSHLWMVISDPTQSTDILIVNFTSWRADKDQACVLEQGDHPYVTKRTCVNFRDAKLCSAEKLDQLVISGQLRTSAPLSTGLLERIRGSVLDSWISQDNAQFLIDQGLVDF